MNISPISLSFGGNTHPSRVDTMKKLSPTPGGMSWLLDSGPTKQSSSCLISNSSSSNNYYSMHYAKPNERIIVPSSTEMMRMCSTSVPEMANIEQSQPRWQQSNPVDFLSRSVEACTSNIFGLYGLEIWKFDKSRGSLISIPIKTSSVMELKRQSSGLFINRVTQEADYESPHFSSAARDAFERLTDVARLDHLSQRMTDPGVGIAGALWSETSTSTLGSGVQSISSRIHRRVGLLAGVPSHNNESEDTNVVPWREVDNLANDPDQPHDERLQSFAKAGFKLAAGIPFNVRGFRGIVVFYANPHADSRKLRHPANSQLLQMAAQFIGSAAAIQNPIEQATVWKNRQPIENWERLRVKILAVVRFQQPLRVRRRGRSKSLGSPKMGRVDSFKNGMRRVASSFAMNREDSFRVLSEATTRLRKESFRVLSETTTRLREDIQKSVEDVQYASKSKGMKWWHKVKGGHASIPPAFNAVQYYLIVSKSDGEYALLLGPLGALTTLQYNLTAAPASQPRTAFFSQVIAISTCYFLHQIPTLDRWHRCVFAPAIVTTTTARLGIIHPPAGAAAVVLSYDRYKPEMMIIFLGGVAISILTAVVINNLSDKRQYPSTSWSIIKR